jgi:hypothetical protein
MMIRRVSGDTGRHETAKIKTVVFALIIGAELTLAACGSHVSVSGVPPAVFSNAHPTTGTSGPELVPETFPITVEYLYPKFMEYPGVAGVPVGTTLVITSNEGAYGLGAEMDSTTVTLSGPPNSSSTDDPWLPGSSNPVWQISVTLKVPADHATYAPYGDTENTWKLNAKLTSPLPSGRDTVYMDPPTKSGGPWVVH